jgi:glycosyltransferase involved in cell wall biosynthesis
MTPPATPFISFLTTAYKTEHYIPATIDSLLAQTRDDWELIVVDNGMSDEMARVVGCYADRDERITLVRQPNKGYRGGVSAAAEHAKGRYVAVLDSDDELLPNYCERVGQVLDADPTIDAVGCDARRFRGSDGIDLPLSYLWTIGVKQRPDATQRLTVANVLSGRVPYYTAAIRREAWFAVGGYEPGIDDVDESVIIWLRLADKFEARLLPDKLARYRVRDDSLSKNPASIDNFEEQLIRAFADGAGVLTNPEDRALQAKTVAKLRAQQSNSRAKALLRSGDYAGARSVARAAYRDRRTVRQALILGGVSAAPGVVRWVHPIKVVTSATVGRMSGRLMRSRHE